MPIKNDVSYEKRRELKPARYILTHCELVECVDDVLNNEMKTLTNGRFYHTTNSNKFYYDWNGRRYELNIFGTANIETINNIINDIDELKRNATGLSDEDRNLLNDVKNGLANLDLSASSIKFSQYPAELGGNESPKIASNANLQTVVEGVIDSIDEVKEDMRIRLYEDDAVTPTSEIKSDGSDYYIKQGSNVVAKINVVKDSFLKSGSIVYGTYLNGEFTNASPNNDGSNAYIKLEFVTFDGESEEDDATKVVYISVSSLIEYSTVANGDLYLTYNSSTHIIGVSSKVTNAIAKIEGLTVNGQSANGNNEITIGANDIIYKTSTTVKDALDAASKGVVNASQSQYVKVASMDANNQQELSVKLGSFSVEPTYNQDGIQIAPQQQMVPGLATVEDVESIILENEEITAAAYTQLDRRIKDLEDVEQVITTVSGDEDIPHENSNIDVVVNVEEDSDSNYRISASADMYWLTELPE